LYSVEYRHIPDRHSIRIRVNGDVIHVYANMDRWVVLLENSRNGWVYVVERETFEKE
jgi:hypothetical protein